MPLLHIAVLALVQGISEFLPVSSASQLSLVLQFTGWPDQGRVLDVAVHIGTLGAVMAYLWRDILRMVQGLLRLVKGKGVDGGARLAWYLALGTLPVVAAGYALHMFVPGGIRAIEVLGWTTLGFGMLLWFTDRFGLTVRRMEHLGVTDALLIGAAQCLALIPGASRSGITMTAGRMLGMERPDCARFSMLLSIPAILGAGTLSGLELYQSGDTPELSAAVSAAGLGFISALAAIALMMSWLRRASFTPFVLYRIALGALLLAVAHGYIG